MPNVDCRRPWSSRAVLLPIDDIDTDQIIPARFLKATGRDGLGAHLFADWRCGGDGSPRSSFPLNDHRASEARILVVGENFGCGSSREHAPWALVDFGFAAIIGRSFADIFRANALKNGLLPVAIEDTAWTELLAGLRAEPEGTLTVDLPTQRVWMGSWQAGFVVDPFAHHCLLEGVDELGYLLAQQPAIADFERAMAAPARWSDR